MEKFDINGRLAVVQPATFKKSVLVKLRVRKGNLTGIVQNNSVAVEPDVLDLQAEEILCLFPHDNPQPGQVYKCKIEPFYEAMRASKWGTIFFYRGLAEAEKNNLTKALNVVYRKLLKPNKLTYVLPITLEIRPNQGQMQGYYRKEKKGIEHAICLCPLSFIEGGYKGLQYLLSHEIGHPLHTLYMPDAVKERWIRLYSSFNIIKDLSTTDLATAHAHFVAAQELPSQYRKQLEDEPKIIFNAILKYIRIAHHLKLEHLDLMVSQKNSDLSKVWPKSKLQLSEMQTPISKYAGKNPTELWCESLAAFALGAEMPSGVKKLVKKSIAAMQPK